MKRIAVGGAFLLALAGPVVAQERWSYPREAGRANPLAPPREVYGGEVALSLQVTTVIGRIGEPPRAVVRLGTPVRERRVVRAGDRIGPYHIDRIREDGVWVRLYVLGSPRRIFMPREGLRRPETSEPRP